MNGSANEKKIKKSWFRFLFSFFSLCFSKQLRSESRSLFVASFLFFKESEGTMEHRASSTLRETLLLVLLLLALLATAATAASTMPTAAAATTTRSSTTKTTTSTSKPAPAAAAATGAAAAAFPFVVGATFTLSSPSVVTTEQRSALEAALPECAGIAEGITTTTTTASSTASSACG